MQDWLWSAALVLPVALTVAVVGWERDAPTALVRADGAAQSPSSRVEPIAPLPDASRDLDPARVALGRRLFHDPRLSGNGDLTCASCHVLDRGGVDGRRVAVGASGRLGEINVPSVLNAGASFRQFWDGRVATLEEQVDGPLLSEIEMAGSWETAIARLRADREMVLAFDEAFAGPPTPERVRSAIADFERALVTPDAPIDRYLRGDAEALGALERRGYALFKSYGCVGCHQGAGIGGNMFQRLGVVRDYFADRAAEGEPVTRADLGRFNVTGDEQDRYVFKVPSLRNVALTAPYFHDGSAQTLDEAVRVMARYQLGRELPDADAEAIVAFLGALTGEAPAVLQ